MARTKDTWGTVREVPQKGSGRFQASYMHGGVRGVTKGTRFNAPSTFGNRGDAWAWLDRERRLIRAGEWSPPAERVRAAVDDWEEDERLRRRHASVPTVEVYGTRYLERDDLAASSRERYRQLMRFYILGEPASITRRGMVKGRPLVRHGLGDIRLDELTRADVRLWWQGLPLKTRESSCRQAYDLLRAILNAAVEDELVEVNPVKVKAAARAQASREREIDPLPIEVLYAVADAMPARWRLGVLLGGVLGLRSGEVRALQRRDFDWSGEVPTLKVARSVKQAESVVELGPLKTARRGVASRTLPIPPVLIADIKEHVREHAQLGRSGLLFWRMRDGGPVRSADWLKSFKAACQQVAEELEKQARLDGRVDDDATMRIREQLTASGGYVFHGTRVTGLTWAYRLSGGNLRAVQAMGGHTSPKMALRYQRAELAYLAEVADNVSGMIERAKSRPDGG